MCVRASACSGVFLCAAVQPDQDHQDDAPFSLSLSPSLPLSLPLSLSQYNPIKTIKTSVMGTMYVLGLAKRSFSESFSGLSLTSVRQVHAGPRQARPRPHPLRLRRRGVCVCVCVCGFFARILFASAGEV